MVEESKAETDNTESEMVSITDATEEDLDAYLEENEYKEDNSINISQEESVDPAVVQTDEQAQQPTQEDIELQRQKVAQQIERYRKQVEGQELLMKRQISKIGEMKRQLINFNSQLLASIGDKQIEDPRGAEIDRMQLNQNQHKIQALENQEIALARRAEFVKTVSRHIPPNEMPHIDALCDCLRADGLNNEALESFRANPETMPASTFIQLQRRAKAENAFKQLLPAFVKVVGENKELKAKLSNGQKNIFSNVERVARQTPSVANATPSNRDVNASSYDVTRLSDSQLEELLKKGFA